MPAGDHISICICTFRRPELLGRLLEKLTALETEDAFSYSVVVVDNDSAQSARAVVSRMAAQSPVGMEYHVESERSISAARNHSVREAKGNLIAFIDDDEFPARDWLLKLYQTLCATAAHGVLGPVLPHFDVSPPSWLVGSGLADRERFSTGYVLRDSRYTRTGNALLRRDLFREGATWFDRAYGRSGGGDAVFFDHRIREGGVFVWCDEAIVYETVPIERQTRKYHLQRAFTRGMTSAWAVPFLGFGTLKSFVAIFIYAVALPFCWVRGVHCLMKYLVKACDHMGKLLAYLGVQVVKERPYAPVNNK